MRIFKEGHFSSNNNSNDDDDDDDGDLNACSNLLFLLFYLKANFE